VSISGTDEMIKSLVSKVTDRYSFEHDYLAAIYHINEL
jgi:hypothetical protein